mmetsp:Transcript_25649/g.55532  ORF Transcript_25649/g.55532 Transcript_25649/m.55532 type:complete len:245 (+) Transcript_25649:318-1052(+)
MAGEAFPDDSYNSGHHGDGVGGSRPAKHNPYGMSDPYDSGYGDYNDKPYEATRSEAPSLGGLTPFCVVFYIIVPLFTLAMICVLIYYCQCQCRCCGSRKVVESDDDIIINNNNNGENGDSHPSSNNRTGVIKGGIPSSVAIAIPDGAVQPNIPSPIQQPGALPIAKEVQVQPPKREAGSGAVPVLDIVVPLGRSRYYVSTRSSRFCRRELSGGTCSWRTNSGRSSAAVDIAEDTAAGSTLVDAV